MSSVIKVNLWTIYSFSDLWPVLSGGWLVPAFKLQMCLITTINTNNGLKSGCLMGKLYTILVSQRWAIWKCRNKAVFDNKVIRHPAEILIHACVFLKYRTGLHKEELQVGLLEGVKTLLACAHRVMAQQKRATQNLLLAPRTSTAEEEEE